MIDIESDWLQRFINWGETGEDSISENRGGERKKDSINEVCTIKNQTYKKWVRFSILIDGLVAIEFDRLHRDLQDLGENRGRLH